MSPFFSCRVRNATHKIQANSTCPSESNLQITSRASWQLILAIFEGKQRNQMFIYNTLQNLTNVQLKQLFQGYFFWYVQLGIWNLYKYHPLMLTKTIQNRTSCNMTSSGDVRHNHVKNKWRKYLFLPVCGWFTQYLVSVIASLICLYFIKYFTLYSKNTGDSDFKYSSTVKDT